MLLKVLRQRPRGKIGAKRIMRGNNKLQTIETHTMEKNMELAFSRQNAEQLFNELYQRIEVLSPNDKFSI